MSEHKTPSKRRAVHRVPALISNALREHKLEEAYQSRPPYQRNDYVGWITSAKLEVTKQKRLNQMLTELRKGLLYMNMAYMPKGEKSGSNPRTILH